MQKLISVFTTIIDPINGFFFVREDLIFETSHQGSDVVICARQWFVGTDCHLFLTTPLG